MLAEPYITVLRLHDGLQPSIPWYPMTIQMDVLVHVVAVGCWYNRNNSVPLEAALQKAKKLLVQHSQGGLSPMLRFAFADLLPENTDDSDTDEWALITAEMSGLLVRSDSKLMLDDVGYAWRVRPLFEKRNLTNVWLDAYLTPRSYSDLHKYLTSRTRHSRDKDEISELAHEFIRRLIATDGLRERLVAGRVPSPSEVRSWAWRRALSIFRDEGIDAQTRMVKNARTDRDLANNTPAAAFQSDPESKSGIYEIAGSDGGMLTSSGSHMGNALVDVVDVAPTPAEATEHRDFANRRMALLEAAVRQHRPNASDRFARVLAHMAAGKTVAEIAALEGVSACRATRMTSDVRAAGAALSTKQAVERKILEYVRAEPMSTIDDLLADVHDDAPLVQGLVDSMIAGGSLRLRRQSLIYVRDTDLCQT